MIVSIGVATVKTYQVWPCRRIVRLVGMDRHSPTSIEPLAVSEVGIELVLRHTQTRTIRITTHATTHLSLLDGAAPLTFGRLEVYEEVAFQHKCPPCPRPSPPAVSPSALLIQYSSLIADRRVGVRMVAEQRSWRWEATVRRDLALVLLLLSPTTAVGGVRLLEALGAAGAWWCWAGRVGGRGGTVHPLG